MRAPTNFPECFVILDDKFTKKELSIAKSFLWFFKERLVGSHEKTFPSIKKISDMADCCKRTVDSFIKKYEGIVITHKNLSAKNGKYTSNQYGFNQEFFENMILLDDCGYLRKWTKDTKICVLKKYMNDEWFLHKILLCESKAMNNEIAHGFYRKLRTIKIFLSRPSFYKVLQGSDSTNQGRGAAAAPTDQTGSGKGNRILGGLPLSGHDKAKLMSIFGIIPLKAAREAYLFKHGDNGNVQNPASFMFMCAREKTTQILKRR